MSKPEQLKELLESIEYPVLMDMIESMWYISDGTVYWNTDDNKQDLLEGEGKTYSGYLPEGIAEWCGYTVANHDTQCGMWVTLLLNNEKQLKELD